MHVLLLSRYGSLGASTRIRSMQYAKPFGHAGIKVQRQSLISDGMLERKYSHGTYGFAEMLRAYALRMSHMLQRKDFDLLWIEKEALPWLPLWLERALLRGVPYVLDYDDAVFHNYDLHRLSLVRRLYGRRLDGLMAGAALVVAGNSYLAQRARDAGAARVEVVPTVIDLQRYPAAAPHAAAAADGLLRIVWIGSPSTARYLQLLREPLQALAKRHTFMLRVIGGGEVDLPGVQVEVVPWTEGTEVQAISACQVGVMPLADSPWERGKCGYKLIQYMACGLPVVASGVGVNPEIVQSGGNGFLASSPAEWESALAQLLLDAQLRQRLGSAGRQRVQERYCIQQTAPRLAGLLLVAAAQGPRAQGAGQ